RAVVPAAVTFHDLRVPYLFPKAGRAREWAVTHLAKSATGVIVTDAADEAELRRRGVRGVARIPIGSNIPVQPPADFDRARFRAQMGVSPNEFLLGYFGFLNHSKGGDSLIRALAVLAERKARVKLALIGGRAGSSDPTDAAFGAAMEKLITRHGLENRIATTGFVSAMEVSAHLLACDAVVLPYRDGVSLRRGSLMAALAHGCAIISTIPRVSIPELRDGENIRLVPPDSPAALVLAISELLDAPELCARLGAAARETAAAFRWEHIAARTLEFFRLG
ncbi:MAG: glycosyltransferase family 4 protein, partial [Anaerolineales bacterium]